MNVFNSKRCFVKTQLIANFKCEWLSHWVQMQNIPNKEKMSYLEGTINDLHQFHFIAKDIMKTMWLRLYTKYRDARVKPTNTIIIQQRNFTLRLPKNNQPTSCYSHLNVAQCYFCCSCSQFGNTLVFCWLLSMFVKQKVLTVCVYTLHWIWHLFALKCFFIQQAKPLFFFKAHIIQIFM